MRPLNNKLLDAATVAMSQNSDAQALDHMLVYDLVASITAANPANADFTAAADDVITFAAAHGYLTGMKFQVSNSGGALPAGLAGATDYYFIKVSDTTGKVATSQANALAGTAVDITDAGTGTHTLEVTTTIAGSVKLQKNSEPENADAVWVDVPSSSTNFTGTTNLAWAAADVGYREVRAVVTVTSGTVTASVRVNAKGA